MLRWLLPKEDSFFVMFEQLGQKILEGARVTLDMLQSYDQLESRIHHIHQVENDADSICHRIYHTLDSTFVTPIDREDIHVLAAATDRIIDQIDAGAKRMFLFKVERPIPEMIELVKVVEKACGELVAVFGKLSNRKAYPEIRKHIEEINRLENEGDRINHMGLARLFEEEKDAITLVKSKEVLEFFERATDACEEVAHVIETIVVKNG